MILLGGSAGKVILNLLYAANIARGSLADKAASPLFFFNQVVRDVSKLSRKILMNIENVHGKLGGYRLILTVANRGFSRTRQGYQLSHGRCECLITPARSVLSLVAAKSALPN